MYQSPGRNRDVLGNSSIMSSSRSNYGSFRSTAYDGQDRVIRTLKKELASLKRNSKGMNEITGRLSNLEHRHHILSEEKIKDEENFRRKENEQEIEVSRLLDELKLMKDKFSTREKDVHDLRNDYSHKAHFISEKEDSISVAEKELRDEYEEYERL